MITVHHLQQSRSIRILWLLEELGLPYEVQIYQRNPATNLAPDAYRRLHPTGKSPIVTDGDKVLAETGAIVEYFLDAYDDKGLRPAPGTPEKLAYTYWMHAAEGSLMPFLVMHLILTNMETRPPFPIRPIVKAVTGQVRKIYQRPSLKALLDYTETELGRSEWLAGDRLTGADIMMSYPLEAAATRAGLDGTYPNIKAYLAKVRARPAYQTAFEKSGERTA